MERICRLCLTITKDIACKLGEQTDLLDKLSSLNIQIHMNELLPNSVCSLCIKTLDDVTNYRENVVQNQLMLLQQFSKGIKLNTSCENHKEDLKTESYDNLDQEDNFHQHCNESEVNYVIKINEINKKNETIILDKSNNKPHYDFINFKDKQFRRTKEHNIKQTNKLNNIIRCKKKEGRKEDNKSERYKTDSETSVERKFKMDHSNAIDTDIFNDIAKRKKKTTKKEGDKKTEQYESDSENSVESKYETYTDILNNVTAKTMKKKVEIKKHDENKYETEHSTSKENSTDNLTDYNADITYNDIKKDSIKCLTCFKYFSNNTELIKHYKLNHNNVNKENCSLKMQIESKSDCNNEIECGNSKDMPNSERAERPYYCKICGRTFSTVYAIIRHARAHSDHSLSCSHGCGYSTAYRGALIDHEKRHNKDYKYKCETCGAGFHVKTWHDQHQNVHKDLRPFVCDLCPMAFHMDRYLTAHRSAVHSSSTKGVSRVCPYCDITFENSRSFKTHLEEHTGKKKYLCALCGKECSSSEQLKHHNNAHLGVKPFVCSICNKSFGKKFNLSVHRRAHAGERHACGGCGKHFSQRSTLRRHARKYHPESKEYKIES